MPVSLEEGRRRLKRLSARLEGNKEQLASTFAKAMLEQAKQTARSRPTPQAPMVAEAMGIRGSAITVLTGGTPQAVSGGSEWGSSIFRQFGPRNEGGYWLHPAADAPSTISAGERWIDEQVAGAVRGF